GYRAFVWLAALSLLSTLGLVIILLVEQGSVLDFNAALSQSDAPWGYTIGPIILIFAIFALGLAHSSFDLARIKKAKAAETGYRYFAGLGALLSLFLILALAAVIMLADTTRAERFAQDPIEALLILLPAWALLPALIAILLSLV